ncbi:TPA: helix-turn-helix domain-containing protein, partial [Enterococcus faecalis]|nr:helix-turn-helix domain-containing protein [Enterococcus faecalis]
KPQKLEIVDYLNKNGFFKFKNSVTELASIFGMSEVSIYKYINEVKISNVNGE